MKNVTALVLACLLALWTAGGDARETETGMESFLVITDTHLTRDPREHAAMMEAVLQAARGRDAVLLLGDNTNNTHAEEHALGGGAGGFAQAACGSGGRAAAEGHVHIVARIPVGDREDVEVVDRLSVGLQPGGTLAEHLQITLRCQVFSHVESF